MNNRQIFFLKLVFLIFGLIGFQRPATAETVGIGLMAGFNSILSEEAYQISNGVKLAAKAINGNGAKSHKFDVVEKDTALDPNLATQTFNSLTQGPDGVKFIIGPQSTREVAQIAPLAKKAAVVLITPSARSDDNSMLNEFVFRTRHSQQQESEFFAPYILRETRNAPLHTLILDSSAGYAFVQSFKTEFSKIGGRFGLFEDLLIDRPNYAQIINKLKANNAAYVLVISLGVQVADLMLEADDAGLKIKFFGTSDSNNDIILKRAGNLAEGFTFPCAFDPENNKESASFASQYSLAFGAPATSAAANAYDAAMLLSACLERVGVSADAVKSCLFYTRNYPGAGGPLTIDRNGNGKRQLFVRTVKNGKFVRLEPFKTP